MSDDELERLRRAASGGDAVDAEALRIYEARFTEPEEGAEVGILDAFALAWADFRTACAARKVEVAARHDFDRLVDEVTRPLVGRLRGSSEGGVLARSGFLRSKSSWSWGGASGYGPFAFAARDAVDAWIVVGACRAHMPTPRVYGIEYPHDDAHLHAVQDPYDPNFEIFVGQDMKTYVGGSADQKISCKRCGWPFSLGSRTQDEGCWRVAEARLMSGQLSAYAPGSSRFMDRLDAFAFVARGVVLP